MLTSERLTLRTELAVGRWEIPGGGCQSQFSQWPIEVCGNNFPGQRAPVSSSAVHSTITPLFTGFFVVVVGCGEGRRLDWWLVNAGSSPHFGSGSCGSEEALLRSGGSGRLWTMAALKRTQNTMYRRRGLVWEPVSSAGTQRQQRILLRIQQFCL